MREPIALSLMLFAFGCAQLPSGNDMDGSAFKSATAPGADETYVRLSLADLKGELPEVGYRQFLDEADVIETESVGRSTLIDAALRKMLLFVVGETTEHLADQTVKIQRFRVNKDLTPVRLIGSRLTSLLPFRLNSNSHIEFARMYESEADAAQHASFSLLDYPHDATSALRLPEGTVVTTPVEANISIDVGGGFVSKSTHISPQLARFLDTSAYGSMSAARRGTIVGTGHFRLQIVRLSESKVRLRLLSTARQNLDGSANLGSFVQARYAFIPAAGLDRLRSIRRRLDQLKDRWDWLGEGRAQIQRLREQLPDAIRTLIDTIPFAVPTRAHQLLDSAARAGDQVLGQAERLAEYADELDDRIGVRVSQAIEAGARFWDARVEPVTRQIQNLSSRIFSISQSVQLDDELSRNLRLLADYEFDLESEESRIAFDRAVSGRAVWRGVTESLSNWKLDTMTFADFTLADSLATLDAQSEHPRVRRLAQGGADMRRRTYALAMNAFRMSVGLNGEFQNNRITLTDEDGRTSQWFTRAWERGQNSVLFGEVRSESFASGAFTNQSGDDPLDGGYWFRWRKVFAKHAENPIAETVAHTLNDLGPLALTFGIPQVYLGEFPGKVSADLFVALDSRALDIIFDPDKTSDEFLWSVLGDMMVRYERPAFLPYAHAPIRPRDLDDIPGARDSCENVAKTMGGRYCYSFSDRIFPALRRAQLLGTPAARLDFFESFYRVPFGGAVLSTRFLIRYLAEILYAHNHTEGVSLDFKVNNAHDDSNAASPRVVVGSPKALILGETTVTDGFNSL